MSGVCSRVFAAEKLVFYIQHHLVCFHYHRVLVLLLRVRDMVYRDTQCHCLCRSMGLTISAQCRLAAEKSFKQQVHHLHVSEALGAVQDTLHLTIELDVVIWLDVEHKLLIWNSHVPGKRKLIRPTQATALSHASCLY